MSKKITIDEEIEGIKNYLSRLEDTDPGFLSSDIKELQAFIFNNFSKFETTLESFILDFFRTKLKQKRGNKWYKIVGEIKELFKYISFKNKLKLISANNLVPNNLLKTLKKFEKLRNEFAHLKGWELREKYENQSAKTKENKRNAYRLLKKTNDDLDKFCSIKLSKKS